jgi:hypothetical protein
MKILQLVGADHLLRFLAGLIAIDISRDELRAELRF